MSRLYRLGHLLKPNGTVDDRVGHRPPEGDSIEWAAVAVRTELIAVDGPGGIGIDHDDVGGCGDR